MTDRNIVEQPYSSDELRVCDHLQRIMPDIGCGEDPIGFLIASHRHMLHELRPLMAWIRERGGDPYEITATYYDLWPDL